MLQHSHFFADMYTPPYSMWYKQTAYMLTEVTKASLKLVSGEVTIAHATGEIAEFSVTSFYEVGLELGLIHDTDMVYYSDRSESEQ